MEYAVVEKLERKFAELIVKNQRLHRENMALKSELVQIKKNNQAVNAKVTNILEQLKLLQEIS